jgi:hypothetical protein
MVPTDEVIYKLNSQLVNALAKHRSTITTFMKILHYDTLNPNLFDAYVIVPDLNDKEEFLNVLRERDGDSNGAFVRAMEDNYDTWVNDWISDYERHKNRLNLKLIELKANEFISDVMLPIIESTNTMTDLDSLESKEGGNDNVTRNITEDEEEVDTNN